MNQPNPQFGFSTGTQAGGFRRPGPIAQFFSLVLLVAIVIVGFVIGIAILIPLVIILLVLGVVLFAYLKIKRFFARTHAPNGPLDGRRNVRVMNRDE